MFVVSRVHTKLISIARSRTLLTQMTHGHVEDQCHRCLFLPDMFQERNGAMEESAKASTKHNPHPDEGFLRHRIRQYRAGQLASEFISGRFILSSKQVIVT